jgi:hypothetical protein
MNTIKKYLAAVFLLLSIDVAAQYGPFAIPGTGFKSVFQNLSKGKFKGIASGALKIRYPDGNKYSCIFHGDSACLTIEHDPDSIYDVSRKHYSTKTKDVKLIYSTYYCANGISIVIDNKEFYFSLIDGACEAVIKGVDYTYIPKKGKELLLLNFTEDVGLDVQGNPETIWDIFIEKGSVLCFTIYRR